MSQFRLSSIRFLIFFLFLFLLFSFFFLFFREEINERESKKTVPRENSILSMSVLKNFFLFSNSMVLCRIALNATI